MDPIGFNLYEVDRSFFAQEMGKAGICGYSIKSKGRG